MASSLLPPRQDRRTPTDRLNRRGSLEQREPGRPRRSRVVALVLTCCTLMALDHTAGDDGSSPVDPLRTVVGEVIGPVEAGVSATVRPALAVPHFFESRSALRDQVADLKSENDALRTQGNRVDFDRNRLQEYEGLLSSAEDLGNALVPARVIGIGAAQTFERTVTIDAGSRAGIRPDLTVVNGDGLVGRVIRVTSTTATVLLIVDADSVVGGRVASTLKNGFLHGQGTLAEEGRLDLDLVDPTTVPSRGDTVVTWGSEDGAPYVAGIPVGTVTAVYSSVRDSTQRAEIKPFVDFGALDVVGVVVPSGTASDRAVIEVDGSLE